MNWFCMSEQRRQVPPLLLFLPLLLGVLLCCRQAAAHGAPGDLLPDPKISTGNVCVYRSVVQGSADTFFQSLELIPPEPGNTDLYDFRMTVDWPGGGKTRARSLLRGGKEGLVSLSTHRVDLSAEGRELLQEEMVFSPPHEDFPADTYSNFAVYFALQGLAAGTGAQKRSLFMAIPSGAVVRLKVRSSGAVWVNVPAGRFRCTKVAARTDLGYFIGGMGSFLNFIGYSVIPKSVLWYMEEDPHLLVRYTGMFLASPKNVPMEMELVRWHRKGAEEKKTGPRP
jgi:hypothetical protein